MRIANFVQRNPTVFCRLEISKALGFATQIQIMNVIKAPISCLIIQPFCQFRSTQPTRACQHQMITCTTNHSPSFNQINQRSDSMDRRIAKASSTPNGDYYSLSEQRHSVIAEVETEEARLSLFKCDGLVADREYESDQCHECQVDTRHCIAAHAGG